MDKNFFIHILLHCVLSHILLHFFRDRQRSNAIDGSNIASYDLYFDDDDDDDEYVCDFDDVDEEYVGDFDAFSPGHSQYHAFSLDGGGFGGSGDKGRYPLRSINFRCIYSFTRSMSYHS